MHKKLAWFVLLSTLVASGCSVENAITEPDVRVPRSYADPVQGSLRDAIANAARKYATTGDFLCESYGILLENFLSRSAVHTQTYAVPMPGGRALGSSGGADGNIWISEYSDLPGTPLLNKRETNDMMNTALHESVHLFTGVRDEAEVNQEVSFCNRLGNLPISPELAY